MYLQVNNCTYITYILNKQNILFCSCVYIFNLKKKRKEKRTLILNFNFKLCLFFNCVFLDISYTNLVIKCLILDFLVQNL